MHASYENIKIYLHGVATGPLVGMTCTTLGGEPRTILSCFADTPRALAVTPDSSQV